MNKETSPVNQWTHIPTYEVRETNITYDWFLTYHKRYWHIHAPTAPASLRTAGHTT